MRKKVLFVISSLGGGGAERVLTSIASQMVEMEIEVKILKTAHKSNSSYELDARIEIIQVPKYQTNAVKKAISMIRFMRNVFKKYSEYTVISFLSDNNVLTILSTFWLQNRIVICERNDPSKNFGNAMMRKIRDILYEFADWNVFQTEDMKHYFSKRIQAKGCVIPNPVMISLQDVYDENKCANRIIAAGRLTSQKNYPLLINAYEIFHKKVPHICLEIYGDGELKNQLQDLIHKKNLGESIKIMPFSKDINRLMLESIAYVSSSDYEGISNTMLEAMALGVPTIVTDCPVGGGRLMIKNGENGILVPVNAPNDLANALVRVVTDDNIRKNLSCNSMKIKYTHSVEMICQKWIEII